VDKSKCRWLWSVQYVVAQSPAAQPIWQQLTESGRQELRARATYWQTDSNPDITLVLADLQRLTIEQRDHRTLNPASCSSPQRCCR
jgi:hypothetical protein